MIRCAVRKVGVRERPLIDDIILAILETAIDSIAVIGIYKNVVEVVDFRRQMKRSTSMLTLFMGSRCLLVCRIAWARWGSELFVVVVLQFREMLDGLIEMLHVQKLFCNLLLLAHQHCCEVGYHVFFSLNCLYGEVADRILVYPHFNFLALILANAVLSDFEQSILCSQNFERIYHINNFILAPFSHRHHPICIHTINPHTIFHLIWDEVFR